ncbi:hypothetical protein CLOM_g13862 [Closterium sp. NIES-68]|nr:hypothetical protein CLOM_g13862 [Closterium sp. NIES-68]
MAAQAGGDGGDGGGGGGGGGGSGSENSGGRLVGDDYVLEKQIGSGSFSVVWRGRRRSTGDAVAIKEIPTERLSSKLHESLESEIAILRRARHPNIVHLLDIVKTSSRMFLVLEYCAGGDLSHHIRRGGAVREAAARHFMRQLGAGLQVLRANNLIHRDLKPQNLLLSERTSAAVLKIADFGFARSLQPQGLAETLCGSPLYMAPEILQCQRYDAKADLWSVGAILFELVVGRPPFGGQNHVHLLQNIKRSEARVPRDIAATLSDDCLGLIRALLKRNPVERLSFEQFFNHPFLGLASIPQSMGLPPTPETPPFPTERPPFRMEPPPFPAEPPTPSTRPPAAAVAAPSAPNAAPSTPAPALMVPSPVIDPAPAPTLLPPSLPPSARPTALASPSSAPSASPYHFTSPHVPPGPTAHTVHSPASADENNTVDSAVTGALRGEAFKEDSDPWGVVAVAADSGRGGGAGGGVGKGARSGEGREGEGDGRAGVPSAKAAAGATLLAESAETSTAVAAPALPPVVVASPSRTALLPARAVTAHEVRPLPGQRTHLQHQEVQVQQQQGQQQQGQQGQQQQQHHQKPSAFVSESERAIGAAAGVAGGAAAGVAGGAAGAARVSAAVPPPATETAPLSVTVAGPITGPSLAATIPFSVVVAPLAPAFVSAAVPSKEDERGGMDSFEMLEGDYVVVDHPSEPSLSVDHSVDASLGQSTTQPVPTESSHYMMKPPGSASTFPGAVAAAAALSAVVGAAVAAASATAKPAAHFAATKRDPTAVATATAAAAATAGFVPSTPLIPPVDSPALYSAPPHHLPAPPPPHVNTSAHTQSLSVQSPSVKSLAAQPHSLQSPSVQSPVVSAPPAAPLVKVSGFRPKVVSTGFSAHPSQAPPGPESLHPSVPSPRLPTSAPSHTPPSLARSGLALAVSLSAPRTVGLSGIAAATANATAPSGVTASEVSPIAAGSAAAAAAGADRGGGMGVNVLSAVGGMRPPQLVREEQQQQQQQQQKVAVQHPQERIDFLRQSGRYIAEIAASKMEAAAPLASLSLHLVALAVWKEALTLSHEWAATSATSGAIATGVTVADNPKGLFPTGHVGSYKDGNVGLHGGGEEAAAAMACDVVEAEFLAAVETAEAVAAAVDRDDPSPVPDALEIIFQTALIAGRSAAVEELMGNMASAAAAYARSSTLFSFLLEQAPRLPISPRLILSSPDRQRLIKYHEGVLGRHKHCAAALY